MVKRYKFGQLNPVGHPQSGITLDPNLFNGEDLLSKACETIRKPSFLKGVTGPLKGVVLQVVDLKEETTESSFLSSLFSSDETKPHLWKVRVRIPELHSHLPDPTIYGPDAPSIVKLYPLFLAKDENIDMPAPGEIVWVDFGDRSRLEYPVCLGRISNKPIEGAVNSTKKTSAKGVMDNIKSVLGLSQPPGDPVDSETVDPNSQLPKNKNKTTNGYVPGQKVVVCKDTKNVLNNSPDCKEVGTGPGLYRTTQPSSGGGFVDLGMKQMTLWVNRNGSSKLVREDLENTLIEMEKAFIEQNGLKPEDVRQFINDGYRAFERQACYYEKYKACLKEWEKQGRPVDKKPTPVAPPGTSKHQNGLATDFNRVNVKNKGALLWTWLRNNSFKFGWVWTGKNYNPQEPWHYEFDEALARKYGLLS